MADRVEIFDVECPPSTLQSAPREVACSFDPGLVEKVWIVIPEGHAGLTGIILAIAHEPVIPFNRRATPTTLWKFVEGNGESLQLDLDNYPDSGAWSAFLYNIDLVAHSWQLRFEVNELPRGTIVAPVSSPPVAVGVGGEVITPPVSTGPGPGEAPEPGEPTPIGEAPEPGEAPEVPVPGEAPEPVEAPEPIVPIEGPGGDEAPEPLEPVLEPDESEPEEGDEVGPTGGTQAPGGGKPRKPPAKKHRPGKTRTVERVTHIELPAGGWLPHGARYDKRREDQGQDGITAWRGPIIAPGRGFVVHNLSDKPFPSGFGHRYVVVHIEDGPFAGHDWYIGHCTSAVPDGHHFEAGAVLAHADQGHVEGGGWFEIGEAPGGFPGPMGNGARFAHLFGPVTITHRVKVKAPPAPHKPPSHGHPPPAHGKRHPPKPGSSGGTRAPSGRKPPAHHPPASHPPPHHAPPPAARRPPPPPAHHPPPPPPPARRPPPPPPPPPPRRAPPPPPPPPRRHR